MAQPDDAPASTTCPVALCPVSMLLSATTQVRPEAVEHLLTAGREFLLALTAILDTRAEASARRGPLQKIEVE